MKYLFPNFLSSTVEYENSVQLWKKVASDSLVENNDHWEDWLTTTFVDGTPMMDGNPIFSLICKKRKRGFTIGQWALDEKGEFDAWVKCAFGDDFNDPDAVEMLAIYCKLTEQNAIKAQNLISAWIKEGTTYEDMKAMLIVEGLEGN